MRDSDVYTDIVSRLVATGVFTDVTFGEPLNAGPTASDSQYLAVVNHVSGDELDDVDPIEIVRRVTYKVEIDVREEDPATRNQVLDRLANTVRNTLNGVSLAGLTLPPLTFIRRDTLGPPRHPNQTSVLSGEFTYLIEGYGGHDDTGA